MPLFSTSDVKEKPESTACKSNSVKSKAKNRANLGKRLDRCADVIGELSPGESVHYVSAGEWSAHDMLDHLLRQSGPADTTIATWSITQAGLDVMQARLGDGSIKTLALLLDWRIKVRQPKIVGLLKYRGVKMFLANCHAKVFTLTNCDMPFAVVGSANFTNNPRIEAGVITTDPDTVEFHHKWMSQTLGKLNPLQTDDFRKSKNSEESNSCRVRSL